ncbi:4-nitrophenyl phosphatase [Persephonella hydrogeniphila]|uniref:4-nitrophenyl phosphatase n=1 Tax=Persephonella hydrogeniphila TaxID=198703 RepID=A0A285N4R0_9AQUI|nr:HAD hydrolase-like protein [Persephonella hydrogeniphila]SNZ03817.1 4-nitrophenyl phosphatase [Persephonella hydrogeniphila]
MHIKGFLIDLDGVLTKDENFSPIDGAVEFIDFLKKKDIPFIIATSNSRYPPEEIIKKMQQNGFKVDTKDIVTPLTVAPYILKKEKIEKIYIIGSENLKQYIKSKGFKVTESPDVDAVLVGLDKNFNFMKMKVGTTALKIYGAKLYALNKNIISKDDDGMLFPGVGTVAKMFSTACQCNEDFKHFGKMGEEYNRVVFEKLPLEKESIAMISDDIFVDLEGYKSIGLKTIFVTTGKYSLKEIEKTESVDMVVDNLTEIIGRIFIDK